MEVIAVRADKDLLQLSTAPRTFDAAVPLVGLEVSVHVYAQARRNWPFGDAHIVQ
jgi:hypothetical protein